MPLISVKTYLCALSLGFLLLTKHFAIVTWLDEKKKRFCLDAFFSGILMISYFFKSILRSVGIHGLAIMVVGLLVVGKYPAYFPFWQRMTPKPLRFFKLMALAPKLYKIQQF